MVQIQNHESDMKGRSEHSVETFILETDAKDLETMRHLLSSKGYRVHAYRTSDGLLRSLKSRPADLLILAWEGLGKKTLDLLGEIQGICPGVAIVLTGETPPIMELIQALKGGAFDFIVKPYIQENLEDAILRSLENRRSFLKILRLSENLKEVNRKLRIQTRKLQEEKMALRKWGEEMNLLNEMSQAVTATLDIEKIIWTAVRHIFRLVPYDVIELTPHWRQTQWVFATPSVKGSVLEEIRSEHPEIVEKKFFVLEDASGTPCEEYQTPASSLQGMASVSLTMNVGELTIGSIRIWKVAGFQQEADPTFDTHQVQLLTMSANTMALALNNATSYHQVQSLATTDGLTGLLNKRSFWASLEKEFKTTARYQTPLSLMMIDIDHFKKINDVFGHQTGDAVLRELAALLGKGLREIDIPARYGGDELAIMLHATPPEQAFFVARRLKTLVERHSFQTADGHPVPVTVSMGIASCPSGEIHKMEDLVAAADRALYTAKRGGRNRVHSDTALFHQDNLLLEMPVA